jgi:mannosyl-glycoprotein endo-beta-N-acetylglucosaminidase/stage II sporulation protein P
MQENFYIKPDLDLILLQHKLLGANNARDEYIKKHTNAILTATKGTGIFPSVAMAQMIIEGANSKGESGKGITAIKANNHFGIKADKNWKGAKMAFNTPKDGKPVSEFRVYPSVTDSIKDHVKFLQTNSRYTKAGVFRAKTPEQQLDALAKAGYSEKPYPQYAKGIEAIIKGYNLKALDGQKPKSNAPIYIGLTVLALGAIGYNEYKKRYK